MRIALIEDSELWTALIKHQLKNSRFEVVLHCKTGDDFLLKTNHISFQLIILDISLPKTNGHEVYQEIRKQIADVPIIVFTSSENSSDIGRFMNSDIKAYINKCRIMRFADDLKVVMGITNKLGYKFKPLMEHELDLLRLVCQKNTYTEIAEILKVHDKKTIENRITRLCNKLGIENKKLDIYEFCIRYGFWNPIRNDNSEGGVNN